jgi:hypothetical protein
MIFDKNGKMLINFCIYTGYGLVIVYKNGRKSDLMLSVDVEKLGITLIKPFS